MPSSNRVVKFTNILNLSAIKFHIPSIQFLKGSESSAVMRGNARVSQGVQSGQVQRAWIPGSGGDSTAHLLAHSWIKCSLLPLGPIKVTVRGPTSRDMTGAQNRVRGPQSCRLPVLHRTPKNMLWDITLYINSLESAQKTRLENACDVKGTCKKLF